MSTQVSPVTLHHNEFHNSTSTDFQHFRKRPFDQNIFGEEAAEQIHNVYKKIKTAKSSANSSLPQTTHTHSLRTEANYSSPFGLPRYTDTRDGGYGENDVERNLFSDVPRIIDLSTGEPLEFIPSLEQLQESRKQKRPIELVENQDKLSSIFETMGENKDDLKVKSSLHSHKRIRTSKEHMCNFIEEDEEEINPRAYGSVVDIIKEFKVGSNAISPKAKPLYAHGQNPPKIKFTVPYQKAMVRYMRSQFQHLNNEEYGNEGKQMVLYRPRNEDYFKNSFVEESNGSEDENDSLGKIFEILDETMDFDVAGQSGAVSYGNEEDQMDID